jgi:hypothetical protein
MDCSSCHDAGELDGPHVAQCVLRGIVPENGDPTRGIFGQFL